MYAHITRKKRSNPGKMNESMHLCIYGILLFDEEKEKKKLNKIFY